MESALLKALAERGCGVEESLEETFMGKEAFYEKILRMLPAKCNLDAVSDACAAGNVEQAFNLSHDLKGMYGNAGLTPLFRACSDIVEKLRAGRLDGVQEDLEALKIRHNELMQVILDN
ncbi:MAG: Hpt domain-containing protein [Victivallales bacterium]|nr:Hpt domain-containing protein [Victivallales bacterium]